MPLKDSMTEKNLEKVEVLMKDSKKQKKEKNNAQKVVVKKEEHGTFLMEDVNAVFPKKENLEKTEKNSGLQKNLEISGLQNLVNSPRKSNFLQENSRKMNFNSLNKNHNNLPHHKKVADKMNQARLVVKDKGLSLISQRQNGGKSMSLTIIK